LLTFSRPPVKLRCYKDTKIFTGCQQIFTGKREAATREAGSREAGSRNPGSREAGSSKIREAGRAKALGLIS